MTHGRTKGKSPGGGGAASFFLYCFNDSRLGETGMPTIVVDYIVCFVMVGWVFEILGG